VLPLAAFLAATLAAAPALAQWGWSDSGSWWGSPADQPSGAAANPTALPVPSGAEVSEDPRALAGQALERLEAG
jgi:hypothetical protein